MKLKLRSRVKFLASIFNGVGTKVRVDGLAAYIDLDFTQFAQITSFDPTTQSLLAQSSIDGSFSRITLSALIAASQTVQIITGISDVTVAATDGLIIMNRTVGAASNVNLPLASTKSGPVKVSDFKGDSGTNIITVNTTGTDKFPGGGTTWQIAANGASLVFTPIPGTGYAV
jgi:hypothetical protein